MSLVRSGIFKLPICTQLPAGIPSTSTNHQADHNPNPEMTSILRLSRIRPRQLYSKNVRRTLTTLPKEDIYDITIVGGGPAGLALTTALRSSPITRPLRIALVDAQPTLTSTLSWKGAERPEAEPYSNRVVSLTPRVVQFLTDIGAWAHVKRERVCAYTGMKVWDAGSGGVVEFDGREGSGVGGGVGFMTENVNLMYGLVRRIEEVAAEEEREVGEKKKGCLTVFEGTKVVGIEVEAEAAREPGTVVDNQVPQIGHWPTLRLEVPQAKDSLTSSSAPAHKHIQTRLLIGADGANSPVRKFAEIEARGWDYDRVGLVATLEIEDSQQSLSNNNNNNNTNKIAYQRFLTTGPIAILPLPGNRASLVWSTTPAYAKILKSLPANTFTALLNAALVLPQIDIDYYLTTYIPTLLHTSTSTTTLHDTLTQDIDWRLSTLASPSPSPSILPFPPQPPLPPPQK
ncbi:hypothetical protein DFH27DRAFT_340732 [Peziza echinospora]|nr:hypothetical protein DFH27DRAFT_340732 [Peziza echinospora]